MAAEKFPTVDQMTGARAGEYLSDHNPMGISEVVDTLRESPSAYQLAPRLSPRGVVDLSQLYGGSVPWPLNIFGFVVAHADTSTTHFEPGGSLFGGEEQGQRIPGVEINFGVSENAAGRQIERQQDSGDTHSLDNAQQREILTFPEGEEDAVTITASDLAGLQPSCFLSNNIIDFYIKYLERRQVSSEDRDRFYFFNSFFFTKLLGNCSAFTDIDQCEVDYDQVRKWTGEVNLFEKDYIFIPILRSSHWSLVVICNLSSLTSLHDEKTGSPCVYHLDPVEGKHESFEAQVRSYIIQAWMERYRYPDDRDRTILALACRMKYVRAKVPQQGNGYDCGLYLLHYVEVFIRETFSTDFSFISSNVGPHFTSPYFAHEASAKRMYIQNLIGELSNNSQLRTIRPITDIPRIPQRRPCNAHCPNSQPTNHLPKPPKVQQKLSKKWNAKETSLLLNRMVEGGRIRKGTEGATHWDRISQDIQTELRSIRTGDECRRRYDTLLKAYKKVKRTDKPFCDISDQERAGLNLATPLTEEWYKCIDTICLQRGSDNGKSCKRAKLNPNDENGRLSLSPRNPPPPPVPSGCPEPGKPSREQVAIPGFIALSENLRSTLPNLIQFLPLNAWDDEGTCKFKEESRRLAIVQDRKPSEIRRYGSGRASGVPFAEVGLPLSSRTLQMPMMRKSNSLLPPAPVSIPQAQWNPLDDPSPLGLTLKKTPALLDLITWQLRWIN